ncbi:MAG: UvrD-helicase domain-containing protein [Spirochaetales bacterium]|nr:UvrD-helicase domain-containing protein [Spirochaetales bacterium]
MKTRYDAILNPEQQKAVATIHGPLLIIAGAGSGKTRVITYRISHMFDSKIPQKDILAVTFTNKAAAEMRQRIRELTQKKLGDLTMCTFHALGLKIIREHHKILGYKRDFTIYDESDKETLIKEIAHDLKISIDSQTAYGMSSLFSRLKTGRLGWGGGHDAYQRLYEDYNHHLKLYHAVDFDDLICIPLKLFTDHPEILEKYQEQYKYIMVDEFQDTSDIQYRFITGIAKKHRNICVVGDDDQSIYAFRGAHFENLLRLEKDFPDVFEIKLELNYRSTKTILEAANTVITNNTNRKPKTLQSVSAQGEKIAVVYPSNEREEGDFIAREIRSLAIKKSIRYSQVGILVRTNHLTRSIEEALLAHNIPYIVSGGISFFNRKEVKDILSYLRVIANPDDDINLLRIINTPRRGIGKTTILDLFKVAEQHSCSLYSAMAAVRAANDSPFSGKIKVEIVSFLQLLERFADEFSKPKKLGASLKSLVEAIDYWGFLLQQHKKEQVCRYKYMNVENLVNSISEYESDPDNFNPTLVDYLQRITLVSLEENKEEENKEKVNVMTVHSAKGLEFDAVFIAAAEDGLFPHARSIEEHEENMEEERRLFYVAITRAKKKLYITSATTRRKMGTVTESHPSPFLEEIPEELTEVTFDQPLVEDEEAVDYFAKMKAKFGTK